MKLDERLRKLTILSEDIQNLRSLTIDKKEEELIDKTVYSLDELRYFYQEEQDKPLPFEGVNYES